MTHRAYPFAPLERQLALRLGPTETVAPGEELPASAIADALGTSHTQVYRWRRDGLSWLWADRLALKAGFLPAELWPWWTDDSIVWAEARTVFNRAKRLRLARKAA